MPLVRHTAEIDVRAPAAAAFAVLEQHSWHYCAAARNASEGGERWEFVERPDGPTLVTLSSWTAHPGLAGWAAKLMDAGGARAANLSLGKRLAYVQFEAERQSGT